jgi:hypothetical protein
MAEPKVWHWKWREKANPDATGVYESSGVLLQTEQDVKDFVEIYYHKLEVVEVHPGRYPGDAQRGSVNPEHFMHGTLTQLRVEYGVTPPPRIRTGDKSCPFTESAASTGR